MLGWSFRRRLGYGDTSSWRTRWGSCLDGSRKSDKHLKYIHWKLNESALLQLKPRAKKGLMKGEHTIWVRDFDTPSLFLSVHSHFQFRKLKKHKFVFQKVWEEHFASLPEPGTDSIFPPPPSTTNRMLRMSIFPNKKHYHKYWKFSNSKWSMRKKSERIGRG